MRFIRDLVDPFAWAANLRAALDYVEGEPNVDPTRIGLWGTSFGGGIAVHLAAHDDRVKALAVQVAAIMSSSPTGAYAALQRARGAVGEQADQCSCVGVGGADGDTEACCDLRECVVPAQVHQPADQGTLVRRDLAAAVTLPGDDEIVTHSTRA